MSFEDLRKAIVKQCADASDAPTHRDGDGWSGSIGGFCPVQGDGTVDKFFWYFRARHDAWSFEVYTESCAGDLPSEEERVWWAQAEYGDEGGEDASWMPYSEAWSIIEASIATGRETGWSMPNEGGEP